MNYNLSHTERQDVLSSVLQRLETIYEDPRNELAVSKVFEVAEVRRDARALSFENENDVRRVMLETIEGIKNHAVHVTHPSYLGLFNPRPNFPSVMADIINSYLNPQLAAWSHSPFAVEIEQYVIQEFGKKFGYTTDQMDGVFCVGGTESNMTAVLTALQKHVPNMRENGLVGLKKQPLIYTSSETHHSMERAARIAGLGINAVRIISTNKDLTINTTALRMQILKDLEQGFMPFMIVGTSGTTGAGVFDDLEDLAVVSKEFDLWLHVDAAYGGGAIITDIKDSLKGIDKSDSITLDLHKWFSVPMGTSIFLTSDSEILGQTFNINTNYMPEDGNPEQVFDPYARSLQWSRRFIGLKIYLPLAVFGWEGYKNMLTHQIKMGNALRTMLEKKNWIITNDSELPIICFTHPSLEDDDLISQKIVDQINDDGSTWISSYPIHGKLSLRAQIANFETQLEDLEAFVELLEKFRKRITSDYNREMITKLPKEKRVA